MIKMISDSNDTIFNLIKQFMAEKQKKFLVNWLMKNSSNDWLILIFFLILISKNFQIF